MSDPRALRAARNKAMFDRRRAAGLCPRCGGLPAPARKYCAWCAAAAVTANRKWRSTRAGITSIQGVGGDDVPPTTDP